MKKKIAPICAGRWARRVEDIVHLFDFVEKSDDVTMPVERLGAATSYDEARKIAEHEAKAGSLPVELWELD